jgi:hypothetical protein
MNPANFAEMNQGWIKRRTGPHPARGCPYVPYSMMLNEYE